MHELSLCSAIADTVREHTAGRRVERVTLQIGYLRQVVPDTLLFCWGFITDGTDLAGSELVVDHIPARISCRACGATTEIDRPILVCGSCDGTDVELISGDEFLVESIDVESAPEPTQEIH